MISLRKPLAFLQKDLLDAASYKLAFVGQFFSIFFAALSWFFLSKLLGDSVSSHLEAYGGDYFSFVLIGVAFASYLDVSLTTFKRSISEAQMLGTLEALLVTQTGIPTLILSASLYSFLLTSFRVLVFLAIGSLGLGMELQGANLPAALLVLLVTITAFGSLGVLSASFVMVLKKGDPVSWLFVSSSWLLGGVYYPISILPDWMQGFSWLLPITYSLEGMRLALLQGRSLAELLPTLLPLLAFMALLLPTSLFAFQYAVRRAKEDGTLTQY